MAKQGDHAMSEKELDHLLIQISKGKEEAFSELYLKTKNGVYAFLYPYFENHPDTEDAMQTVYLKIRLSISDYQKHTNGRAWILQIAKNVALNEIKKQKRIVYVEQLPEQKTFSERGFIFEAMQNILSKEENEIVILHVLWGYKHQEIAKMKNCPVGTITSKYKRSLQKLQTELKKEE